MLGREPPDDELILHWWNDRRGERADTATPAMRAVYVREVEHPARIAEFDAQLAQLLTPSEWAFIVGCLPDQAQRGAQRSQPDQGQTERDTSS